MGIRYNDLNDLTRDCMFREFSIGNLYISPRLTIQGQREWSNLLQEAISKYNDDWLSNQLQLRGYFRDEEIFTRDSITRTRKINKQNAAQQLAEGEFNRYYIRGLCLYAQSLGIDHLIVYRGKEVNHPRPESEAKIGKKIFIEKLLPLLRSNDFVSIESAFGVPGGPNSGLTCKLP